MALNYWAARPTLKRQSHTGVMAGPVARMERSAIREQTRGLALNSLAMTFWHIAGLTGSPRLRFAPSGLQASPYFRLTVVRSRNHDCADTKPWTRLLIA